VSTIVGIDLGTTNSAIAVLDDAGRPKVVENDRGDNITPSAVLYGPEDITVVVVGHDAKESESSHPNSVFQEFKRGMDQTGVYKQRETQEPAVTAIELSALVLKKLVQDASGRVGHIDSAVITVPANFADEARRATIAAGEQAGLTIKHIVNEPTAALFYYSFERPVGGTVLVYDLGGGTLDVSIANVDGRNVEIVTSKGDPRLGGLDFDKALYRIIEDKFEKATGERLVVPDPHGLARSPEEYKKQLSTRDKISVQVTGGVKGREIIEITREEYEAATSLLIGRADMLVEGALSDAGLAPGDIEAIFLVGGATRMPMVTRHLESLFGKPPICNINPDEVVALGAALYAGVNADQSKLNAAQASSVQSMKLREVANHHYGTVILDSSHAAGPRLRVSVVIEKNTPIPVSKTESFFTVSDSQTSVECTVTQAATRESDPEFVRTIWEGKLGPLPANRPSGQQIDVTFSYDANQVMECSFTDVATGTKEEVSLGLTEGQTSNRDLEKFQVT
jgi:molecular chaperone DnaK